MDLKSRVALECARRYISYLLTVQEIYPWNFFNEIETDKYMRTKRKKPIYQLIIKLHFFEE